MKAFNGIGFLYKISVRVKHHTDVGIHFQILAFSFLGSSTITYYKEKEPNLLWTTAGTGRKVLLQHHHWVQIQAIHLDWVQIKANREM